MDGDTYRKPNPRREGGEEFRIATTCPSRKEKKIENKRPHIITVTPSRHKWSLTGAKLYPSALARLSKQNPGRERQGREICSIDRDPPSKSKNKIKKPLRLLKPCLDSEEWSQESQMKEAGGALYAKRMYAENVRCFSMSPEVRNRWLDGICMHGRDVGHSQDESICNRSLFSSRKLAGHPFSFGCDGGAEARVISKPIASARRIMGICGWSRLVGWAGGLVHGPSLAYAFKN